jgi:radical SAM superfamily enzyme with C-terminal helix-hairpin-helix motif
MTPAQWMFHYLEIKKHKQAEIESENKKTEVDFKNQEVIYDSMCQMYKNMYEVLNVLTLGTNKEIYEAYIKSKENPLPENSPEELDQLIKDVKELFPDNISINIPNPDRINLPKINRKKPGIQMKGSDSDV